MHLICLRAVPRSNVRSQAQEDLVLTLAALNFGVPAPVLEWQLEGKHPVTCISSSAAQDVKELGLRAFSS